MATYSALPFDIVYHLCCILAATDHGTLKKLSATDRRTRSAAIPLLFRSVIFTVQWGTHKKPWQGFEEQLGFLTRNDKIMSAVRELCFAPRVSTAVVTPIPRSFFDFIRGCVYLEKLCLSLHAEYLPQVQTDLVLSSNVSTNTRYTFPSVRSLQVPTAEWLDLSPCFPGLTSLYIDRRRDWWGPSGIDFILIAKLHPHLVTLHVPEQPATPVIHTISKELPNLKNLGLFCTLTEGSVVDHLQSFTCFPHLRSLYLPDLTGLGLGYNPPWCGNAYSNPGTGERVKQERMQAQAKLIKGVEDILIKGLGAKSSLQTLVVGHSSWYAGQEYVKDQEGNLKLTLDDDEW